MVIFVLVILMSLKVHSEKGTVTFLLHPCKKGTVPFFVPILYPITQGEDDFLRAEIVARPIFLPEHPG